jgi:hypothetical protein
MTTVSRGAGVPVRRFGDFELDRRTLELRKSGQKLKLADRHAVHAPRSAPSHFARSTTASARTGKRNAARLAIQRVPFGLKAPPVAAQWRCTCWLSV